MQEIWKDINGYEGKYQISNHGNVKSVLHKEEKILKPLKHSKGYLKVILYKDKKATNKCIHRLVAEAFLNKTENKFDINHKDGDKHNNHISNLEWCTKSENMMHAWQNNLRTITEKQKIVYKYMAKAAKETKSKKVKQYNLNRKYINTWDSMSEASKSLNISRGNISSCCSGKLNHAGGYIWEFA